MYFKFFFCPISRVRVSNPQRLTSRQILVDYPLPSRGGSVKCQLVKTKIIIQIFLFVYYCFLASGNLYVTTSKSFIFSLVDKEKLAPFKCMVKQKRSSSAIFNIYRSNITLGPTFGAGYDIHIADNANQNNNSYTNFGSSYSLPNGVTNRLTILAGTYHFSPEQVEVFYLT